MQEEDRTDVPLQSTCPLQSLAFPGSSQQGSDDLDASAPCITLPYEREISTRKREDRISGLVGGKWSAHH